LKEDGEDWGLGILFRVSGLAFGVWGWRFKVVDSWNLGVGLGLTV